MVRTIASEDIMAKLSVNVNKIATLRNSRGKDVPNVLQTSLFLQRLGVDGITVHPRPDERHIRYQDVLDLKSHLQVEFNVEGYPSQDFLSLIDKVIPDQVTLVPDPPGALTSNAGWTWQAGRNVLPQACERLLRLGTRVSLFVDPASATLEDLDHFKKLGVQRLELYTEQYADDFASSRIEKTLHLYRSFADKALERQFGLNAGHDLTARNVRKFLQVIPEILEVSIGHAFIADSLHWGLAETLKEYKKAVDLTQEFQPRQLEYQ